MWSEGGENGGWKRTKGTDFQVVALVLVGRKIGPGKSDVVAEAGGVTVDMVAI